MSEFAQAYADTLRRAAAFRAQNGGAYPEPPDEPIMRCPVCHDSGWIAGPLGEGAVECTTCDVVASRRRAKFGKLGPVPSPYDRYTFADFPGPAGFRKRAEQFAAGAPCHLFLSGPVGTGKTSLASCVYRAWLEAGAAGMWFTVPGLLDAIRAGFDRETRSYQPQDLVEAVCTVPVLLLDDVGAERVTDWVAAQLYTVVNRRQERPTIFTSNLNTTALAERLGGIDGERIASRIEGMCAPHIYEIAGPDLRQAKNRRTA